jgi:hypothetical protein
MGRINTLEAPDFVYWVMQHVGNSQFGYVATDLVTALSNDDFDGSLLTSWAANQVASFLPTGQANQLAFVQRWNKTIPVSQALVTRGALLWSGIMVAVSLGDGKRTVEASGRIYGVRPNGAADALALRWTAGGLVPGLRY